MFISIALQEVQCETLTIELAIIEALKKEYTKI